jgi:DNA primase large subunit
MDVIGKILIGTVDDGKPRQASRNGGLSFAVRVSTALRLIRLTQTDKTYMQKDDLSLIGVESHGTLTGEKERLLNVRRQWQHPGSLPWVESFHILRISTADICSLTELSQWVPSPLLLEIPAMPREVS